MSTHHPFTTNQLLGLSALDVSDLISRAGGLEAAYATETQCVNDTDRLPWWVYPGGFWRRIHGVWPGYNGQEPWRPVFCANQPLLEFAWTAIAVVFGFDDGDWAYDTGKSCEANARDVLALVNDATNIEDEN